MENRSIKYNLLELRGVDANEVSEILDTDTDLQRLESVRDSLQREVLENGTRRATTLSECRFAVRPVPVFVNIDQESADSRSEETCLTTQ